MRAVKPKEAYCAFCGRWIPPKRNAAYDETGELRDATNSPGWAPDSWCEGCAHYICFGCHIAAGPFIRPDGAHDFSVHPRPPALIDDRPNPDPFTFKNPPPIIEIPVTARALAWARAKAKELGVLPNSITGGVGNVAGFIGDAVVHHYTGGRIEHTYDYDVVIPDGRHVDAKTVQTTVRPKHEYLCSVADYNTKQKCDLYAFVRVREPDFDVAWVLGCMEKETFYRSAKFFKKGEVIGSNNHVVEADCYKVSIGHLSPLPRKP